MKHTMLFAFIATLLSADITLDNCNKTDASSCIKAAQALSASVPEKLSLSSEQIAEKAAQLYKKACELGSAKGCTAYGMHFYADSQRDRNKTDLYYFKKGCDGGDQAGCVLLKMAPKSMI